MDDPSLHGIDIDAISSAVDALDDDGVTVTDIRDIDRDPDDGHVRFTLTCRAETRHQSIDAWTTDDTDTDP